MDSADRSPVRRRSSIRVPAIRRHGDVVSLDRRRAGGLKTVSVWPGLRKPRPAGGVSCDGDRTGSPRRLIPSKGMRSVAKVGGVSRRAIHGRQPVPLAGYPVCVGAGKSRAASTQAEPAGFPAWRRERGSSERRGRPHRGRKGRTRRRLETWKMYSSDGRRRTRPSNRADERDLPLDTDRGKPQPAAEEIRPGRCAWDVLPRCPPIHRDSLRTIGCASPGKDRAACRARTGRPLDDGRPQRPSKIEQS
jgi:hypothetical protein